VKLSFNGKFTKAFDSCIKDDVDFMLPKSIAFWELDKHNLSGFSIESYPIIRLSFKKTSFISIQ
jgi:hypothetical protein